MHIFRTRAVILAVLCLSLLNNAHAKTFALPADGHALIGEVQYTTSNYGDTPTTIAERYNIGLNAVVAANSGLVENSVMPAGKELKVATQFLLPPVPRHGIVINLPEMRLYYYPKDSGRVMTFPVGIGK